MLKKSADWLYRTMGIATTKEHREEDRRAVEETQGRIMQLRMSKIQKVVLEDNTEIRTLETQLEDINNKSKLAEIDLELKRTELEKAKAELRQLEAETKLIELEGQQIEKSIGRRAERKN